MGKMYSVLSIPFLSLITCFIPILTSADPGPPDQGIVLYTTYTSQSITPGKSLTYNIEVINKTDQIQNISLALRGLPDSWEPSLTAGSNSVQEIAVKPQAFESEAENSQGRSEEHTSELQSRGQ